MIAHKRRIPTEAYFWIAGLVFLAITYGAHTIDFCIPHRLGLPCPGCGLGRSIEYLLHGQLSASFHAHPLGLPALAIITHRIWELLRPNHNQIILKGESNGQCN